MADGVVLKSVRIVEVRTLDGPILFRTESLWYPSPGWKTELVTYDRKAAHRRASELLDGLNATESEKVVWTWSANGHRPQP